MFGTYANGTCPDGSQHLWTVNDLSPNSETHAPLFGQALYNMSGAVNLALAATELPYINPPSENPVEYLVGSGTALVALSGNIPINGGVAEVPNVSCEPNSYVGVPNATNQLWNTSFTVASGQNGNVMLLLKTRVLDCQSGTQGPGTASLYLVLDGQQVGSAGVQQYVLNQTCHQRTLSASYLALGLSQGTHTLSGLVTNSGLPGLAVSGDMGLLYFGN